MIHMGINSIGTIISDNEDLSILIMAMHLADLSYDFGVNLASKLILMNFKFFFYFYGFCYFGTILFFLSLILHIT